MLSRRMSQTCLSSLQDVPTCTTTQTPPRCWQWRSSSSDALCLRSGSAWRPLAPPPASRTAASNLLMYAHLTATQLLSPDLAVWCVLFRTAESRADEMSSSEVVMLICAAKLWLYPVPLPSSALQRLSELAPAMSAAEVAAVMAALTGVPLLQLEDQGLCATLHRAVERTVRNMDAQHVVDVLAPAHVARTRTCACRRVSRCWRLCRSMPARCAATRLQTRW